MNMVLNFKNHPEGYYLLALYVNNVVLLEVIYYTELTKQLKLK